MEPNLYNHHHISNQPRQVPIHNQESRSIHNNHQSTIYHNDKLLHQMVQRNPSTSCNLCISIVPENKATSFFLCSLGAKPANRNQFPSRFHKVRVKYKNIHRLFLHSLCWHQRLLINQKLLKLLLLLTFS